MSWRQSTGRTSDTCNRCRQTPDLGAPLYIGEHTGACWCERCAAEVLGQSPGGPVPMVRSVGDMDTFNPKVMGAQLREKILARPVSRSSAVGSRGCAG